jgi:opacity protein-like surface antigen
MMKETLLGFVGGAVCLSTAFATEAIQPINVNALIGLSAQDSDDTAEAGTAGHARHAHHAHQGAGQDSEHGPHLRISAGVNLISDTDIKDSPDGIKWDTGVEFNVAYGIPLMGDLAVEIGVGMAYNSMKETYNNLGQTGNLDGELWQIPLMAHLVYEFHLGESLVLGVSGGAGIQYNSITFDPFAGFPTEASQSSWTFRYEAGLELTWSLSETSALGAYAKYAWAPGIELPQDGELKTAGNMGVGVMWVLEF